MSRTTYYRSRRRFAAEGLRARGAGWTVLSVALDDASRAVYVELLPDELGATAAGFLRRAVGHFAGRGVAVQRVLTDNRQRQPRRLRPLARRRR